ncbi:MAG: Ku protein [Myxococcaceae bacterium]|nr:Ku protein [Myxococcaceae bacterium]
MSARATASGTISFGLVNIPIKVFSANDSSHKLSFNQLHADKKTRLKQQMYDPTTGEIVPKDKIVKGFEYAKDQYVVFTDEELDALELATSRSMEISEFVPLSTVDPLYFESGSYLGPDKGSERPFALLVRAMEEMKHAAIAKFVARGKQQLVLLRPLGKGLVLQNLRYADEVRSQSEVPLPDANPTEAELGLAREIISRLSLPAFDVTKFRDEYREKLKDLIDRKVKGETINLAPAPEPVAKVVDLMEALKASLARTGGAPVAASPVSAPAAPAAEAPKDEERKPPKRAARSDAAADAPAKKAKGGKR